MSQYKSKVQLGALNFDLELLYSAMPRQVDSSLNQELRFKFRLKFFYELVTKSSSTLVYNLLLVPRPMMVWKISPRTLAPLFSTPRPGFPRLVLDLKSFVTESPLLRLSNQVLLRITDDKQCAFSVNTIVLVSFIQIYLVTCFNCLYLSQRGLFDSTS